MSSVIENWQRAGFGLYVHWPFCQAKCPYCDFNSHVVQNVDQAAWAEAYVSEINRSADETPARDLSSIFFGGGTPSLMQPKTVEKIIGAAQARWRFKNDIEITLEANPTSIEAEKFAGFRAAGVNRVSIGIQALNDVDLKRLGRLHSAKEALAALEIGQSVFDRVSFDLIYARQDQSLEDWKKELDQALTLGTDHLSLYQLTIEPDTAFGWRHARGHLKGLPDDDRAAEMYEHTAQRTAAAGYQNYEVSNYCKPGAGSRHNMIYWHGGDYVGIGPGAHGRISTNAGKRIATEAVKAPGGWKAAVRSPKREVETRETLSPEDAATEYLLMGLRIEDGISLDHLKRLSPAVAEDVARKAAELTEFVQTDGEHLWIRPDRRILTNAILNQLL